MTRPLRPEVTDTVVAWFADYLDRVGGGWGSLHIVLSDNNLRDVHVRSCAEYALEQGDSEGYALALVLLGYSKGQRQKIGERAEELERRTRLVERDA